MSDPTQEYDVDVAILGAGTGGMSAYREASKYTDRIALIDGVEGFNPDHLIRAYATFYKPCCVSHIAPVRRAGTRNVKKSIEDFRSPLRAGARLCVGNNGWVAAHISSVKPKRVITNALK